VDIPQTQETVFLLPGVRFFFPFQYSEQVTENCSIWRPHFSEVVFYSVPLSFPSWRLTWLFTAESLLMPKLPWSLPPSWPFVASAFLFYEASRVVKEVGIGHPLQRRAPRRLDETLSRRKSISKTGVNPSPSGQPEDDHLCKAKLNLPTGLGVRIRLLWSQTSPVSLPRGWLSDGGGRVTSWARGPKNRPCPHDLPFPFAHSSSMYTDPSG